MEDTYFVVFFAKICFARKSKIIFIVAGNLAIPTVPYRRMISVNRKSLWKKVKKLEHSFLGISKLTSVMVVRIQHVSIFTTPRFF